MTTYSNYREGGMRNYSGGDSREKGRYNDSRDTRAPITQPTPCNVTTNLYKYIGKDIVLHQYAVTFRPEINPKIIFEKFLQILEKNNFKEKYAFDGTSILVSKTKFSDIIFTTPMRDGELHCKIEYKHSYDTSDKRGDISSMMQCLEIVSRYYQKLSFYVDKGKIFSKNTKSYDLGGGLEIIPGLSSSFKLSKEGFYCNLDMAFGVFYRSASLIELLTLFCRSWDSRKNPLIDDMGSTFYTDFEKFIKGLKVATVHREHNSSFKISGIRCEPATSVEFKINENTMSVAAYFAKVYKPLKYPNLPLIVIKKGDLCIYLPFEVLALCPMQKYSRKLDENLTSQMIRVAAKRPHERFAMIAERSKELAALQNETLADFGMVFDNKMLNCKGTIIPAPKLSFADNKLVHVNNGAWNLIGVKALAGIEIKAWKIFTFRSNNTIPSATLNTFIDLAIKYGIRLASRPETVVFRTVKEFYHSKKECFNLVILPDKNAQRYEEVKRIAETYNNVITQCIVASNIVKLSNPSFVSNLLLKVNAKHGGKNGGLSKPMLNDKPTILIGIDINHPGVTDVDSPSILSIVGSMDPEFISYKTIIEQQERRKEIIGSLNEHIKTLLRSHFARTGAKPSRIIVFRDGVGDSMFQAVYNCEIESIRQGIRELDENYHPEINFIIAQKRHSVRFESEGRNLLPGTVVDEIGQPDFFDFYLVSANALQGTARPIRYLVVCNDSNFSKMEMYETVYNLCHLYARATKSVSVVPPIYYAHLGAARGKCYLEKKADGSVSMRVPSKELQKNLFYI